MAIEGKGFASTAEDVESIRIDEASGFGRS